MFSRRCVDCLGWLLRFLDDVLIASDGSYEDRMAKVGRCLTRLEWLEVALGSERSRVSWLYSYSGWCQISAEKDCSYPASGVPRNEAAVTAVSRMVNHYRYMRERR